MHAVGRLRSLYAVALWASDNNYSGTWFLCTHNIQLSQFERLHTVCKPVSTERCLLGNLWLECVYPGNESNDLWPMEWVKNVWCTYIHVGMDSSVSNVIWLHAQKWIWCVRHLGIALGKLPLHDVPVMIADTGSLVVWGTPLIQCNWGMYSIA